MAKPPPYVVSFSFAGYQSTRPSVPLPGVRVDTEYNNIANSITGTQTALADIRRDDGKLKNGIVTPESLDPGMALGVLPPVPWATGVQYAPPQSVWQGNKLYQCILKHVSTVFATDLANKCWNLVVDFQPPIDQAANSATAAANSATAAAGSATAANTSKTNAATSAANAATSETNALASKNAAASSATAASGSATAAAGSAVTAKNEADRAQSIANAMLPDAPSNGTSYGRLNGAWQPVLAASAYTAADVLAKIKTVDGVSSGLDADLLDGLNSSFFAPLNNPLFTGIPQSQQPSLGDSSAQIATTKFVKDNDALLAPINNPSLTGTPIVPVASPGTNTAQIASTSFVQAAIATKLTDAPADGSNYGRRNNAWVATLADALTDSKYYARRNGVWAEAAPLDSPVFTGDARLATSPATADNDTSIASTAFVKAQAYITSAALVPYAPLASPVFTGNPTVAASPPPGDNDLSLATTAFVTSALIAAGAVATAQARNRIVNPAMQISQENGLAVVTNGQYVVDQFFIGSPVATVVAQKSGLGPHGLTAVQVKVSTAKPSLAAGDFIQLTTRIEGIRVADFQWGTASAKPVVLRFWAYSNGVTNCTYTVTVKNGVPDRTFAAAFTLPTPGTWYEIAIPIPGDTTGTWPTDNNLGMHVIWGTAAGSTYNNAVPGWQAGNPIQIAGQTNMAATANGALFLADVGLYLDPLNTGLPPPWQMPDEADELQACMRYYQSTLYAIFAANVTSGVSYYATTVLSIPMRTPSPALSGVNSAVSSFPATVGTLGLFNQTTLRETRVASASASGVFASNYIANARM